MDIFDHGCQIEKQVLSATECDLFLTAFGTVLNGGGRAGARHLMSRQAVNELANDRRLLRLAQEALGGNAVPFRATRLPNPGIIGRL